MDFRSIYAGLRIRGASGNFLAMSTGVGLSQLIMLVATPFISRIFLPEYFGDMAFYLSVITIIGSVSSGKLEFAIPLAASDREAAQLSRLAMLFIIGVSLFSILPAWLVKRYSTIGARFEMDLMVAIPAGVFLFGVFQIQSYWFTRRDKFTVIAGSLVLRAVVLVGTQLLLGYLNIRSGSALVAAHLAGQLASSVYLFFRDSSAWAVWPKVWLQLSECRDLILKVRNFWTYSAAQALVNSASQQFPTLLIAAFFIPEIVGQYSMALRILFMPVYLIGNSVRQVVFRALGHAGANIYETWKRYTVRLGILGVIFLVPMMIWGPDIFALVLGETWRSAGEYSRIISPWIALTIVNPPTTSAIQVIGMQRTHFVVEVWALGAKLLGVSLGGYLQSPIVSIFAFSFLGVVVNMYLMWIVRRELCCLSTSVCEQSGPLT